MLLIFLFMFCFRLFCFCCIIYLFNCVELSMFYHRNGILLVFFVLCLLIYALCVLIFVFCVIFTLLSLSCCYIACYFFLFYYVYIVYVTVNFLFYYRYTSLNFSIFVSFLKCSYVLKRLYLPYMLYCYCIIFSDFV